MRSYYLQTKANTPWIICCCILYITLYLMTATCWPCRLLQHYKVSVTPIVSLLWRSNRLARSKYPKSCAGGSIATGRVSHARQGKAGNWYEKVYPGPPGWGLGMRPPDTPPKNVCWENFRDFRWAREEWRHILREVRAQKGLECLMWMESVTSWNKFSPKMHG